VPSPNQTRSWTDGRTTGPTSLYPTAIYCSIVADHITSTSNTKTPPPPPPPPPPGGSGQNMKNTRRASERRFNNLVLVTRKYYIYMYFPSFTCPGTGLMSPTSRSTVAQSRFSLLNLLGTFNKRGTELLKSVGDYQEPVYRVPSSAD